MSRLVYAPSVHVIASTVINADALEEWAAAEGLYCIMEDADTPLGKIFGAVRDEEMEFGGPGIAGIGNASLDRLAELSGRHCYRSWDKGRDLGPYIENIIESGHGSVLRHGTLVFAISGISRTLSLELIRHHVGADVSQESQRYVDAKDVRFVVPPLMVKLFADNELLMLEEVFEKQCLRDLKDYETWISELEISFRSTGRTVDKKRILEAARSRLPNCAETRMVWTMNMNSMRNIIAARGSVYADLEIRRLAVAFCREGQRFAPHIFSDFRVITADDGFEAVLTSHPKV